MSPTGFGVPGLLAGAHGGGRRSGGDRRLPACTQTQVLDLALSEIGVPGWGPYYSYKGILLFVGSFLGSPIFVNSHFLVGQRRTK